MNFGFSLVPRFMCVGFPVESPQFGPLSAGLFPCVPLLVEWPSGHFAGGASSLWYVGLFGPFRYFLG